MDRNAAVAGQFYPAAESELRRMVEQLVPTGARQEPLIGAVVPHAGYIYSGAVAGKVFARIRPAKRIVLLGPNHHGHGHPAAVYPSGRWHTPLGAVRVDEEFAGRILDSCPGTGADTRAHLFEHSLEVMLPFIQVCAPSAEIVPICMGQRPLEELLEVGEALGELLSGEEGGAFLLASSDMTHYESAEVARRKDMQAIDRVLALDPEGLYRTVRSQRITMCGVVPVVAMLAAARILGATRGELIGYANSGDVTGERDQVVGYAGMTVL